MRVVRFVAEPQLWTKAFVRRDDGDATLPIVALRAFTPLLSDNGCLSLYRLDPAIPPAEIVSAFWFMNKASFLAVSVDEERLAARNLKITNPPGETFNSRVNPLHVDLNITTTAEAIAAAEEFFTYGKMIPMQEPELHAQIANDNAAGFIDFERLAKSKASTSHGKLIELVAKGILSVC